MELKIILKKIKEIVEVVNELTDNNTWITLEGTNCTVKYNSFLGIAALTILVSGVAMSPSEVVRDLIKLPNNIRMHNIFLRSNALSSGWKPLDNNIYISLDRNNGVTIQTSSELTNAVLSDTFFIPFGSWWVVQ